MEILGFMYEQRVFLQIGCNVSFDLTHSGVSVNVSVQENEFCTS